MEQAQESIQQIKAIANKLQPEGKKELLEIRISITQMPGRQDLKENSTENRHT